MNRLYHGGYKPQVFTPINHSGQSGPAEPLDIPHRVQVLLDLERMINGRILSTPEDIRRLCPMPPALRALEEQVRDHVPLKEGTP